LDVGTGSGVLALALARLGVERVVALDTDPAVVPLARANLARNGAARLALLAGPLTALRGRVDLVVANLLADAIVAEPGPRAGAEGPRLRLSGADLRHLRAYRVGPGERFLVFGAAGAEHEARLVRLGGRLAEATILATHRPARESPLDLVLAPALLKGAKMDL